MMTSALLSVSDGMRVADVTGTHSMKLSGSPCVPNIAFAISRPMSVSNPSHLLFVGFFTLKGGLSSCVPTRSFPFTWIEYMKVWTSNFGLVAADAAGLDVPAVPPVPAPPQAPARNAMARPNATARAMPLICALPPCP